MDQQVSPAVVIVVLILVMAIVVALYFLVVQGPAQEETPTGVMAPAREAVVPLTEEAPPSQQETPRPGETGTH